jgi:hypothetical protein
MQPRPRRCLCFLAFLLLSLVAGSVFVASRTPSDSSLLKRATRITTLESHHYFWLTPQHLLLRRQQPGTEGVYHLDAVQLDCLIGKITPISALNRDLYHRMNWPRGHVSLDGKWFVMPDGGGGPEKFSFKALALKENRVITAEPKSIPNITAQVSNVLWFPDNRRWIFLGLYINSNQGLCAIEQSLDTKQTVRGPIFSFPSRSTLFPDGVGSRLLGCVGKDRILALPSFSLYFSKQHGAVHLYEFSVGRSPNVKEYSLPLPQGPGAISTRAIDAALSSDGNRLALLVRHYERPSLSPLSRLMGRWFPSLLPKPQLLVRLYTMRPDGTDLQLLGTLPVEGEESYSRSSYQLQWLLDGKRLSFVYQSALWTIPSDI